jgi:hypothetical protein
MPEERDSSATLPLTFGGVASFAQSSFSRLFAFQIAVALMAALAMVGFFELAWVPVFTRILPQLPVSGEVRDGKLSCSPSAPVRDTSSSFLWLTLDPTDSADRGEGADLQIELGQNDLRFRSLFGYLVVPYPADTILAINRREVEPWWGAWHPAFVLGVGAGVVVLLFASWSVLALLYTWPVRVISFYADRHLSLGGAWRLASAALLPGAILMVLAAAAYTFQHLNLVQLLAATALHFIVGWIYILGSPFCLPRTAAAGGTTRRNPFGTAPGRKNPFAGRSAKDKS